MRTTVTLDADVARLVKEAMRREDRTFKDALNEAIRRGLTSGGTPKKTRYRVTPHQARLLPGLDPAGFNRLADELETEAVLRGRR